MKGKILVILDTAGLINTEKAELLEKLFIDEIPGWVIKATNDGLLVNKKRAIGFSTMINDKITHSSNDSKVAFHVCQYCGQKTDKPDEDCFYNPANIH